MRNLCVSMLCLAAGCAHSAASNAPALASTAEPEPRPSATAFATLAAAPEEAGSRAFVEKLAGHDFSGASGAVAEAQSSVLTGDKLGSAWTAKESEWGQLIAVESVLAGPYARGFGALVTCRFEKGTHTLTVFFDQDGKIDGFWFTPAIGAANLFVDALGYHHPELADVLSDADMHAAAPPDKLAAIWSQLEEQLGSYQGIAHVTDRGANAEVVAAFSHRHATFEVAVNGRGRVVGFHLVGSD